MTPRRRLPLLPRPLGASVIRQRFGIRSIQRLRGAEASAPARPCPPCRCPANRFERPIQPSHWSISRFRSGPRPSPWAGRGKPGRPRPSPLAATVGPSSRRPGAGGRQSAGRTADAPTRTRISAGSYSDTAPSRPWPIGPKSNSSNCSNSDDDSEPSQACCVTACVSQPPARAAHQARFRAIELLSWRWRPGRVPAEGAGPIRSNGPAPACARALRGSPRASARECRTASVFDQQSHWPIRIRPRGSVSCNLRREICDNRMQGWQGRNGGADLRPAPRAPVRPGLVTATQLLSQGTRITTAGSPASPILRLGL